VRSSWWAEGLGPLLVGLTEGAWIVVLYLLVETVGRAPAPLGLPVFAATAFLGALAGPGLERLGERRWKVIALVAVGLGAVGTLAGPGVLGALIDGNPGGAFGAHPGGWLLGIAAFRGMLGGGTLEDPDRASRPFIRGVIGLTFVWLYAGLLPDVSEIAFRTAALGPTLLFASSGVAAVGLRRVHAIALPAGIEWWRNRAWLLGLGGLLALLTALAVPIANELMAAVPRVLGLAGFPEVVVFVIFVAWLLLPRRGPRRPHRSAVRGVLGLAILLALGAIAYRLIHANVSSGNAAAGVAHVGESTESNGMFGVLLIAGLLLGLGLLALFLTRSWRPATPTTPGGPGSDESGFEVEGPGVAWLRRLRNRLRGERTGRRPASAEAAYLATLDLLEPLRELRRLADETPAAHARRLHREGAGSLELDLLAADYQLSRWGARRLPARETGRAIGRWDRSSTRIAEHVLAERVAREHAEERELSGPA
jgi:hypothetical protein